METMKHKKRNRYPFKQAGGGIGETMNSTNLMCPDQISSNPKYRNNYDEIQWDGDSYIEDMERMERQKSIPKEN